MSHEPKFTLPAIKKALTSAGVELGKAPRMGRSKSRVPTENGIYVDRNYKLWVELGYALTYKDSTDHEERAARTDQELQRAEKVLADAGYSVRAKLDRSVANKRLEVYKSGHWKQIIP